jgi:hypothetical protein
MGTEKIGKMYQEESKSPLFDREFLIPKLNKIVDQISQLDTKSNREMSPLHKKREEILHKIE